jgi:hypothetical protein
MAGRKERRQGVLARQGCLRANHTIRSLAKRCTGYSEYVRMKIPKSADVSNKPPTAEICIDKVSITLDVEKDDAIDHKNAIRETMFDFAKQAKYPFTKFGRISAKGGRYEAALRIHAPNEPGDVNGPWSKEIFATLQCNPKNGQGGFLRLEWNPAKWTRSGSSLLLGTLEQVMFYTPQFDQLLSNARVTRVDVALDIPGILPGDYLWAVSGGHYREWRLHSGKLETLYLGAKDATKGFIRIYDKGVETGEPGLKMTRVERVFRSNKLRLQDLPARSNVFHSLRCYDVYAALTGLGPLGVPPMHRNTAHDTCCLRGLGPGVDRFENVKLQKALMKAIKPSVPAFWDPSAIWSKWPAAVADAFFHEPIPPSE